MAAAIPAVASLAGPVLGSIFGAKGASGQQGKQTTEQTQLLKAFQELMRTGTSSQTTLPLENPLDQAFRFSLQPLAAQEFRKAQAPVYGDREKAQGIQDIEDAFSGAMDSEMQKLAGAGALDSGRAVQAAIDTASKKAAGKTSFLNQIPMLNEQARRSGSAQSLDFMRSLAALAPTGSTSTGTTSETSTGTSTQEGKTSGTSTNYGAPFTSNLFNNLGYMFGKGQFDPWFAKLGGLFGGGGQYGAE